MSYNRTFAGPLYREVKSVFNSLQDKMNNPEACRLAMLSCDLEQQRDMHFEIPLKEQPEAIFGPYRQEFLGHLRDSLISAKELLMLGKVTKLTPKIIRSYTKSAVAKLELFACYSPSIHISVDSRTIDRYFGELDDDSADFVGSDLAYHGSCID